MLCCRYGDRTPKSNKAKAFAMVWFLVGLVVFGLFSASLTADLTVTVSTKTTGGQESSTASKIQNVRVTYNHT